ncbi:MAG: hypothetical protein IPH24_17795 [Crocinitomicaceae bacterium]|nr:hypothetical protein [Crocinitomicaceae bacterium]
MIKRKLNNNQQDFENLLTELKSDEGTELTFESEVTPKSFPCMVIYHHSDDVDFGSVYDIAFVYASDFG